MWYGSNSLTPQNTSLMIHILRKIFPNLSKGKTPVRSFAKKCQCVSSFLDLENIFKNLNSKKLRRITHSHDKLPKPFAHPQKRCPTQHEPRLVLLIAASDVIGLRRERFLPSTVVLGRVLCQL